MTLVATSAKSSGSSSSGLTLLYDSGAIAGAQASIDSGATLAGTLKTLMILIRARSAKAAVATDNLKVTINGDTGANYFFTESHGNGTGLNAGSTGNAVAPPAALPCPAATAPAGNFGSYAGDCFGYADAFQKSLSFNGSYLAASNNFQSCVSCLTWTSTAVINQIAIAFAADNLIAGSRLTIFGS